MDNSSAWSGERLFGLAYVMTSEPFTRVVEVVSSWLPGFDFKLKYDTEWTASYRKVLLIGLCDHGRIPADDGTLEGKELSVITVSIDTFWEANQGIDVTDSLVQCLKLFPYFRDMRILSHQEYRALYCIPWDEAVKLVDEMDLEDEP